MIEPLLDDFPATVLTRNSKMNHENGQAGSSLAAGGDDDDDGDTPF